MRAFTRRRSFPADSVARMGAASTKPITAKLTLAGSPKKDVPSIMLWRPIKNALEADQTLHRTKIFNAHKKHIKDRRNRNRIPYAKQEPGRYL